MLLFKESLTISVAWFFGITKANRNVNRPTKRTPEIKLKALSFFSSTISSTTSSTTS